jgi:geranylgeranyl diphosphate synthase, type I
MAKDDNSVHIRLLLDEKSGEIRRSIERTLLSDASTPELTSILKEIVDNWRDVFRPALTALSCEAVGGKPEATANAGLMFALASAGFGIHDDIIDRSERKHFRTTILGRHGVDSALLVGDLLLVKAWAAASEMIGSIAPETVKKVLKEYGRLNVEICEAELLESRCRKKLETDLKTHEGILWKAMAEIEACTRIGAILGGGSESEVEALAEYGRRLGFAYRLTDELRDTLNIEGNLQHRLQHESMPLPLLYAAKSSEERYRRIQTAIQKESLGPADIRELLEICFDSKAPQYIYNLAKRNETKNSSILKSLRPSSAQNILSTLNKQSLANIKDLVV